MKIFASKGNIAKLIHYEIKKDRKINSLPRAHTI